MNATLLVLNVMAGGLGFAAWLSPDLLDSIALRARARAAALRASRALYRQIHNTYMQIPALDPAPVIKAEEPLPGCRFCGPNEPCRFCSALLAESKAILAAAGGMAVAAAAKVAPIVATIFGCVLIGVTIAALVAMPQ